jgi:GTP-binding protein EngB required for normal cell division
MTEAHSTPSGFPPDEMVRRLQAIHDQYSISSIRKHLDACTPTFENRDFIDVGIFGRFKAGKSSLLNLLAGKTILPVGVLPVTAVITRLHFGPREQGTVRYLDGRSEAIAVESVKYFVAEAENPQNTKKVSSVDIELPSLNAYHCSKQYSCLRFVDTPGLESVFQHNTEMALDWLPKVGLALVTVSVDPPLSRSDLDLIRNLRNYTPKIAILLTKADRVSDLEREEITAFIHEALLKEFGSEFQVVPISVHSRYRHLKTALDQKLLLPLAENFEAARTDIARFKFNALLDRTKEYLSLALAAAERKDADRAKLKAQVLNEKTSVESIRMELQALATECAGQTRPWIVKQTEALRVDLEKRLTLELSRKLSGLKTNLWSLSRAYEEWLQDILKREISEISFRNGDIFLAPLERARDTLMRAVQGFHDRLAGNIEQALGMKFRIEPFEIAVKKPSSPDVAISNLFMFNTDLLWFVIPMTIFRSWANKHFVNRIPYETEKNLSRLASQWTDRINDAILKMQRDAEQQVRDQISTVESLLSRAPSDAEGIRQRLSEVESFRWAVPS